ncbi:MAG: hypothetical protein ACUVSH_06545 [Anaerolineae bacterium]
MVCRGHTPPVPPAPTTPTAPATDLYLLPSDVAVYPPPAHGLGGPHLYYRGDTLSFDVTPRGLGAIPPENVTVRIYRLSDGGRETIAEGTVGYPAFDGVPRARFAWIWDTANAGGRETLVVHLDPDDRIQAGDEDPSNNIITLTVRFLAAAARPAPEAAATWAVTTAHCCIIHYLTSTSAERDLPTLMATTERAVAFVQEKLGVRAASPLAVYLIARVLGHGGYAQGAITVSYPDRHYAGTGLEIVLRHEVVHILDAPLIGPRTPALLREGLAVWIAGGHYKPEPIAARAGALIRLRRYIPLDRLAEDFYRHQHEVGYLEAAAFIAYLVETYGWDAFLAFYRESGEGVGESPAEALDGVLQHRFGISLAEIDRRFREWLVRQPTTPEQVRDLELTIRLWDAVRRYQQIYDPQAYFMSGWLPDPVEGEKRGIVADFIRHPQSPEAVAIETMLASAQEALEEGALDRAAALVEETERALSGDFSASQCRWAPAGRKFPPRTSER